MLNKSWRQNHVKLGAELLTRVSINLLHWGGSPLPSPRANIINFRTVTPLARELSVEKTNTVVNPKVCGTRVGCGDYRILKISLACSAVQVRPNQIVIILPVLVVDHICTRREECFAVHVVHICTRK